MINILFILIAIAIVLLMEALTKSLMKIFSTSGFAGHFRKYPIERSIVNALILGSLSIVFLLFICLPFTSKTGFNLNEIEISLKLSLYSCLFIAVFVLFFMYIYKKVNGDVFEISYPIIEGHVKRDIYLRVRESRFRLVVWLIYRWILVGIFLEILFRGIVLSIIDFSMKEYIDFGIFKLSYSVIATQIVYHLVHLRIRFKPFHIDISLWEQICILPVGILAGIVCYYTESLIGPIIIHSFYSGISATLYLLFRNKNREDIEINAMTDTR